MSRNVLQPVDLQQEKGRASVEERPRPRTKRVSRNAKKLRAGRRHAGSRSGGTPPAPLRIPCQGRRQLRRVTTIADLRHQPGQHLRRRQRQRSGRKCRRTRPCFAPPTHSPGHRTFLFPLPEGGVPPVLPAIRCPLPFALPLPHTVRMRAALMTMPVEPVRQKPATAAAAGLPLCHTLHLCNPRNGPKLSGRTGMKERAKNTRTKRRSGFYLRKAGKKTTEEYGRKLG